MEYKNLLTSIADRIMVVTVNRPDKLNALNHETLRELKSAMLAANTDDEVDVIVVTGAGEKAFVAGADIGELSEQNAVRGHEFSLFGQDVFNTIEQSEKPVIAAVNGYALGGGCELALACHIRFASENARFGQPEVNLGTIPGYGGTQRLARVVGLGRAMEMVLSGNMLDAAEALRIGLVNKQVPAGEVLDAAIALAKTISGKGQVAVRLALKAMLGVPEMGQREGLKSEAALFGLSCGSEDFQEGTSAFLEKRKPEFKGQ